MNSPRRHLFTEMKCITVKVTEQIINQIIVFAANFKALKMKVNKMEK